MAATKAEDRAQTRLLLAQRTKPARDRAVVRALLRALGVAVAASEVVAPVAAPIDVRCREAHFHLRDLGEHQGGRDGPEQATRGHPARAWADGGNACGPAVRMAFAVIIPHITAALAEHAAWYGARCVGLDALVSIEPCCDMLVQPSPLPEVGALTVQGWRSVSVMCPPYGMVLYAADGAPAFLRLVSGRLVRHGDTIDTRCDRAKR